MSLYNCKLDGEQYRISKFTNDLDVEASYLTDGLNCDCPAGHRPACRHRIMLSRFIAKNATAGQWFHNYEHQKWIRAASDDEPYTSATLGDLMIYDDLASAASELTATEVDERIRDYQGPMPGDGLIGAMVDSTMKTINLLELAKPPELGGFPWECYNQGKCPHHINCIIDGCAKGFGQPSHQSMKPEGAITGRFTNSGHIKEVEPQPKPLRRL